MISATAVEFRYAERKDTAQILQFIKELANYEKMLDQVVADEATLEEWLFDKQKAEVIFALEDGKEVGFALFFHNFSTFLGRAGIYLEDLYVRPECRGKGYGKALLKSWPSLRWSVAAGGWNGGAWTGISPASRFICLSARNPCRTGRFTGSQATPFRSLQNRRKIKI